MKDLHLLTNHERDQVFRFVAEEMNMPFAIIEKDYWVVWILKHLFALKELKSFLTFKGGTSLSKVYRLIDRFSEDIDLSIEKSFFGFDEHVEMAASKKKQRAILDQISKMCSKYIQTKLLNSLQESIAKKIGITSDWKLFPDFEDPTGQTLLFEYPSISSKISYIRPLIKIEIGARSEHWPVTEQKIESYVKETLKAKVRESKVCVRVLHAKRTFWEKATILHQYAHLPDHKKLPPRISRHFYDFFRLLNSSIKEQALVEPSLLERVATHKSIYFASGWANYETARRKTLQLLPPVQLQTELQKDYMLMQAMFFGDAPKWDDILQSIYEFQKEFNES